MFATAGTLNPENENEEFSMHREEIIRTAQNLTEDTKSLITSTSASQEQLAVSAQNSVHTIKQLADIVKQGATSFGSVNSEAQVLLLNSVKDVAAALCEMISAAKSASGKNPNDQTMMAQLKDASHVLIENVTSMLKTVKTVEDEHLRGTRALEATMESINQELRSFDSGDVPRRKATPEQLVNSTKPIHLATSKLVAAGNSLKQEDIIVAANMGRKAISDLLVTVKQAAWSTDQPDDRRQVLDTGRECALQYRRLLEIVHQLVSRPMTSSLGMSSHPAMSKERQQLADISRNIAASITRIGACAEQLKGADWVNPSDPTVIAETELLGATSAIEAAAMKLASLRPRRTSVRVSVLLLEIFCRIGILDDLCRSRSMFRIFCPKLSVQRHFDVICLIFSVVDIKTTNQLQPEYRHISLSCSKFIVLPSPLTDSLGNPPYLALSRVLRRNDTV